MRNYFENDYTSYKYQEGILYVTYHEGVSIDLKAAVKIVEDRLFIHEGLHLPVLVDIRGIKEIDKPARAYLAIEGSTLIKAVAVIVRPPVSKMLSEFYIRTSNPIVPTQSFDKIEEAIIFLKTHIS
ncbi:hypothetical protein SAMN05428642_101359 [Flaviramulus basaltis]|uniref:DUF7793 domain-containing protein n=1 Tax=Flaviramulus basaltis TaxID=369401 RepID=A0A1K2IB71_9FLAO|nr:hypothetical protein [Flaviramulus basaltis]SFZ89522.1 hypothetical protein SAMN05428642_101359 [Flaviramulus basaltis]